MSIIKDAHFVLRDSDFSPHLSVTFEIPLEAVVDSYSRERLDMRAEMGEIIFAELETYLRVHNLQPK